LALYILTKSANRSSSSKRRYGIRVSVARDDALIPRLSSGRLRAFVPGEAHVADPPLTQAPALEDEDEEID